MTDTHLVHYNCRWRKCFVTNRHTTYFWSDWNRAVKFRLSSARSWSHGNSCQSRIMKYMYFICGWSCLHGLREDPVQGIPWLSWMLWWWRGEWAGTSVQWCMWYLLFLWSFDVYLIWRVPLALYLNSSTNNSPLCVKLIPWKLCQWCVWDHHHVFDFWIPIMRVFLISWPNLASHNILIIIICHNLSMADATMCRRSVS